ncbi:MAG: nucleotidyltransferase domain-containing protein [Melioribacteraceae bacterium]|nr:nucleotidyltransferase domain-containing protein [Melioribacteraceae bacterium]
MRIKEEYIDVIKQLSEKYFGKDSKTYLFGSRSDDTKKGGDIDLYIETSISEKIFERKVKMLVELQKLIGEQKIDLVINNFSYNKIIYQVARHEGILL